MRITSRQLRQVIREEITRSLHLEQDETSNIWSDEHSLSTTDDEAKVIDAIRNTVRSLSLSEDAINILSEILGGRRIVSRHTPNNVDANLIVNSILSAFTLANIGDKKLEFEMITSVPSAFSESFVKAVQRKLGITVDGDFGRGTLVAALTNGEVKMTPAHLKKNPSPNMFKLISQSVILLLDAVTPAGMGFKAALEKLFSI